MVDTMRGDRTGQVSSGVGIEGLQMMAQSLIRLRARDLENVQDRIGRKLISRIFQFTPPEEILEVVKNSKDLDDQSLEAIESELLKPIAQRRKEPGQNSHLISNLGPVLDWQNSRNICRVSNYAKWKS